VRELAAILGAAAGGRIDVARTRDGAGWQRVVDAAGARQLLPSTWSAVRALDLLVPVPEALLDALGDPEHERNHPAAVLQRAHRANGARNADLLAQLDDAAALAGVPVVAIKGIGAVARGVYDDPADRVMRDLDLLVARDEASAVHDRLRQAGYEIVDDLDPHDRHHLRTLRRRDRFGSIEVHVAPVARGWRDAVTVDEVLREARPVGGDGRVLVPCATHAAVIALVHAYLADGAWHARDVPLRTIHELWLLDRREPVDWPTARRLLQRVGRGHLVDEHLVLAHALLGAPERTRAWRPRLRHMLGEHGLERAFAPVERVAAAFDTGRLRRHYGPGAGGPWRLRATHLLNQARRRRAPAPGRPPHPPSAPATR